LSSSLCVDLVNFEKISKTNLRKEVGDILHKAYGVEKTKKVKLQYLRRQCCEGEYSVSSYVACQANWLDSILKEMTGDIERPIQLLVDNKSIINLANNLVSHGRSKYI